MAGNSRPANWKSWLPTKSSLNKIRRSFLSHVALFGSPQPLILSQHAQLLLRQSLLLHIDDTRKGECERGRMPMAPRAPRRHRVQRSAILIDCASFVRTSTGLGDGRSDTYQSGFLHHIASRSKAAQDLSPGLIRCRLRRTTSSKMYVDTVIKWGVLVKRSKIEPQD